MGYKTEKDAYPSTSHIPYICAICHSLFGHLYTNYTQIAFANYECHGLHRYIPFNTPPIEDIEVLQG